MYLSLNLCFLFSSHHGQLPWFRQLGSIALLPLYGFLRSLPWAMALSRLIFRYTFAAEQTGCSPKEPLSLLTGLILRSSSPLSLSFVYFHQSPQITMYNMHKKYNHAANARNIIRTYKNPFRRFRLPCRRLCPCPSLSSMVSKSASDSSSSTLRHTPGR